MRSTLLALTISVAALGFVLLTPAKTEAQVWYRGPGYGYYGPRYAYPAVPYTYYRPGVYPAYGYRYPSPYTAYYGGYYGGYYGPGYVPSYYPPAGYYSAPYGLYYYSYGPRYRFVYRLY